MITFKTDLETYKEQKALCHPHEYLDWVKEVDRCLIKDCMPHPMWADWVGDVVKELRKQKTNHNE